MENIKKTAIILASYGSPESKDDLPEYLREVFNGRDPPEFAVLDTQKKYTIVNYISPSGQIIRNLRDELEKMMMTETKLKDVQIVNAFKHWKPSLVETIRIFAENGVERIKILPLFPLRGRSIYESYMQPVNEYVSKNNLNIATELLSGICLQKSFKNIWKTSISRVLREGDYLLFTAHSLPKPKGEEELYIKDLENNSRDIARELGCKNYGTGFQSRGPYGKNWLEPGIYDILDQVKDAGYRRIVSAPIGFMYDHLEILYDLDILFAEKVRSYGMEYARAESPNNNEHMVKLLFSLIRESFTKS